MSGHQSTLGNRAFGDRADPGLIVAYQSHQDAMAYLEAALERRNGCVLLQGPGGAGKTTITKQIVADADGPAAHIDAISLPARQLLTRILSKFDVPVISQSEEQMLPLLDNFLSRETREGKRPLLVLDNADNATASVLSLLNWLAALQVGDDYSLRIVLTGRERMAERVRSTSLRNLARRHPATYSLNPLTEYETRIYLRTRLIAGGGDKVEALFSDSICSRLYELSRGWPGTLNDQALSVMQRADEIGAAKPVPQIIVTRDGETVGEYQLEKRSKYVIGRSELADIVIEDGYASKLHAMLQVYGNAVVLSDLNSTNGTIVNSREVRNTVLRNNDIIMMGRHRLKIVNAPKLSREMDERIRANDTVTLKSLDDLRKARARRTIAALKHKEAG